MKYLLLIYNNPQQHANADNDALMRGHHALYHELAAAGVLVSSAALKIPPEPATVRVQEGLPAVTDGPFLEAKEYLAGYYLVDCESKQQAYEIAARIPCGANGAVEVRAVDEQITAAVRGEAGA
jgi:hypothetical protein